MFKFAVKCGLAGGAVYYLAEEGVWKESVESTKLCGKMNGALSPYLQEVKTQIPVEFPQLPSTDRMSFLTKHYWNKGVIGTFTFLGDLPQHASEWKKKGIETVTKNEELKKFIESFSSSTPQPQAVEQKKK